MTDVFEIHASTSAREHVLALSGELDIATAPELSDALMHLSLGRITTVVFDLSRLSFIDSGGLQGLLDARQFCGRHKCNFAVVPGPARVQRVFEVCGVLGLFPFRTQQPPQAGPEALGATPILERFRRARGAPPAHPRGAPRAPLPTAPRPH